MAAMAFARCGSSLLKGWLAVIRQMTAVSVEGECVYGCYGFHLLWVQSDERLAVVCQMTAVSVEGECV
jgi:hypothetical protein